jgi:hypothetical protein
MNTFNRKRQIMEHEPSAQDEIIEMWNSVIKYAPSEVRIAEFAKLVAAKEREACAVACEKELEYWGWNIVFDSAKLIRARGKQAVTLCHGLNEYGQAIEAEEKNT